MKAIKLRNHRRSGWQLVELSFVISVFALIAVCATRLIVGLMAIENRAGSEVQDTAILDRLAEQWRADLHRATAVEISHDSTSLQFDLTPDTRVEYRIDGDKLTRQQSRRGQKPYARETYLAAARRWRFEQSQEGRDVTLIRESAPHAILRAGNSPGPSKVDSIQAAVGLLTNSSDGRSPEGESP
jgi:hypothetical protein